MTLVYAKIMGMFVCGADPGGGGVGVGGKGGIWNSSQVTSTYIWLWGMDGGWRGGAMMGVGRVVVKGAGDRL